MITSLVGLNSKNVLREALAGVTLLAIAVPLNIGYAQIAGLPPAAGLYALVVPAIVYALVVSSRQLVASPDAAAAALVASSVGGLAVTGGADFVSLALAQAILCGCMFIAASIFKLGFLATFLSKPILVGFVGGLAVDILVGQIAKMLGISIKPGGEFIEKLSGLVAGLGGIHWWSAVIAGGSLAVLIVGRHYARSVPWALIALVLGTVAMATTGLSRAGVAVLGEVQAGAPTLQWPVISWYMWAALVPSAIALTMVTMGEGLLLSRAYSEKRGYPINPNRDLLAFGLGNIAAGASGSFAVGSSTARTAAMDQAGSRTQLPMLVMAAGTLLLLIFGTALLRDVPAPAIGAVVAMAVWPLLGFSEFRRLWKYDRFEFLVAAVCFLVTLFVGSIPGIIVAFVLALINLAKRAANPPIDVLASHEPPDGSPFDDAPATPGVIVVRLAGPLFFANSGVFDDTVMRAVAAEPAGSVHDVVFDMHAVSDIDVTAAETFASLRERLASHGIALSFSRVRLPLLNRLRELELLGDSAIYSTNKAALAALAIDTP